MAQPTESQLEAEEFQKKTSRRRMKKDFGEAEVSFQSSIYAVMKQVAGPKFSMSRDLIVVMNEIVAKILQEIAGLASQIARYNNRITVRTQEVFAAMNILLPAALAQHGQMEATKAIVKFTASGQQDTKRKTSSK